MFRYQLTYAIFKTFSSCLFCFSLWLVNCLNFVSSLLARASFFGVGAGKGIKAQECLRGALNSSAKDSWIYFPSDEIFLTRLNFSPRFLHIRRTNLHHSQTRTIYDENEMKFNSQSFFLFFLSPRRGAKKNLWEIFPESGGGGGRGWDCSDDVMRQKNIVSSSQALELHRISSIVSWLKCEKFCCAINKNWQKRHIAVPDFAEELTRSSSMMAQKEQRKVHESSVELFSEQQNNTGKKLFLFQLVLFPACVHFSLPTRLTFIRPSSAIVLCKREG